MLYNVPFLPYLFPQVSMLGSVLHLRGAALTEQPLVGHRGVLAWNGEVWDPIVQGNDTAWV